MSNYKKYYNNSSATNTKQIVKKKVKKDWTYWVVVIALAFTFLGSILGTIAFAKSCVSSSKNSVSTFNSVYYNLDNKNNSSFSASAFDTNTETSDEYGEYKTFTASNFFVPLVKYTYTNNSPNYNYTTVTVLNFAFDVTYEDNLAFGEFYNFNFNLTPLDNSLHTYYASTSTVDNIGAEEGTGYFPFNGIVYPDLTSGQSLKYYFRFGDRSSSVKYQCYLNFNFDVNNDTLLNNPITKIEFGNEKVNWYSESTRHYISPFSGNTNKDLYYFNTVKYYQNEYLVLEFGFLTYNAPNTNYLFENRSYYTLNGIEGKSEYQLGYDNGKDDGLQEGLKTGTEDGFERGKIIGESIGFDKGYRQGLNDSNSNTFYSLIGAVIDVPIGALQSLLNFELLGFNLFNFLTALVTLGLIIFVVRLFI